MAAPDDQRTYDSWRGIGKAPSGLSGFLFVLVRALNDGTPSARISDSAHVIKVFLDYIYTQMNKDTGLAHDQSTDWLSGNPASPGR